jgi:hypothetical protein
MRSLGNCPSISFPTIAKGGANNDAMLDDRQQAEQFKRVLRGIPEAGEGKSRGAEWVDVTNGEIEFSNDSAAEERGATSGLATPL